MTSQQRWLLWFLGGLLSAALCYGILYPPLRDYRETTYAEIGREMLVTHEYLVPHLNGTPHLDKPPLVSWLVALSYHIFGIAPWVARLPSVLATLWTACVVGWITRRLFGPNKGLLAAVLLLGTPGSQYYGRMLMTDTVFVALTCTAMAAFLEGYVRAHRGWYLLGFVACGFGILTRGLLGMIYPLGTLVVFFVMFNRPAWRQVPWSTGVLLMLLFAVPWFAFIEHAYPGFLDLFIIQHHLDRFNPAINHGFIALPRWQILVGFAGFLGPLALLLPWSYTAVQGSRAAPHMLWLLALAVLTSVLLSTGRNHPYTLPALPPLVILVAAWLGATPAATSARTWHLTAMLIGLFGLAVLGSLPWLRDILAWISPLLAHPQTLLTLYVCLTLSAVCILIGAFFLWQGQGLSAGLMLALMMLPGTFLLTHVQLRMAPVESRAALAQVLAREALAAWPVVIANPRDHLFEGVGGWGFYAQRQVQMVALHSPVHGPFQGVTRPEWIIDRAEFFALWRSGQPFVLIATPQAVTQLALGVLPTPSARDARFSLWLLPPQVSRSVAE